MDGTGYGRAAYKGGQEGGEVVGEEAFVGGFLRVGDGLCVVSFLWIVALLRKRG